MAKKIIQDVPNLISGPKGNGKILFFAGAAVMFAALFFAGRKMEKKNAETPKNPSPPAKPSELVAVPDAGALARAIPSGSRTAWLDGIRRGPAGPG